MKNLELPLLSFSVQAANNKLISKDNPAGFVPQLLMGSISQWAMNPDGCMPSGRLAELAPGCGWIADRATGLRDGGYDIGPYAGEDGRRCDRVWPRPLYDIGDLGLSLDELRDMGMQPALFVGSPMQRTATDRSNAISGAADIFSQAAKVAELASIGILTIFDTGGCVGPSDARDTFELLHKHKISFYLEPTRPYHMEASATVALATGLVSTTERMRTMEQETKALTRAWFDTATLELAGLHDVEWCVGISVQYAMERARMRLRAGRRVIMPLRLLDEAKVRQLVVWRDEGTKHAPVVTTAFGPVQVVGAPAVVEKPTLVRRP